MCLLLQTSEEQEPDAARTDRGPSRGESDNKIDEYSIKSKQLGLKSCTGDLHDVGELSLKNHGSNPTQTS
jgi:hypothetical protein